MKHFMTVLTLSLVAATGLWTAGCGAGVQAGPNTSAGVEIEGEAEKKQGATAGTDRAEGEPETTEAGAVELPVEPQATKAQREEKAADTASTRGEDVAAAAHSRAAEPVSPDDGTAGFTPPEIVECKVEAENYYMVTDEKDAVVPCLTLFDDGTFGFTYDILSSYYPRGTYRIEGDRLTAVTDDGTYTYVFEKDGDSYIFLQEESSDITLFNENVSVPITDRAVFALRRPGAGPAEMTAVVKEKKDDCFLVSSKSDSQPGVYYVYFGENDVRGVKEGDQIRILWDGSVLETDPGQIYADTIELAE